MIKLPGSFGTFSHWDDTMKFLRYVMEYMNIFMEKSWKCHGNSFKKMRGHPEL